MPGMRCLIRNILFLFLVCAAAVFPAACRAVDMDVPRGAPLSAALMDDKGPFIGVVRDVGPSVVSLRVEMVLKDLRLPSGKDTVDEKALRDLMEELIRRKMTLKGQRRVREASGLILTSDGYVLTNNHVVTGAERIDVRLHDRRVFEGKVVATDDKTDLAVLRIEADGLKVPRLGDSDMVEPGEWAIAIGSPYGFEKSVTLGVVSAKGRPGFGMTLLGDLIQTDASINPGNSGGPLVNIRGEVIGINSILTRPGQGISFAIPINLVKRVARDLIERGRVVRPWVGMALQELTTDMKSYFGLKKGGALVRQVIKNGPSDTAGLKEGDIIIEIEGRDVENTQSVLNEVLGKGIGEKVDLVAVRKDKRSRLSVVTADEETYRASEVSTAVGKKWFGLSVRPVTPGIAQNLGEPDIEGVIITGIEQGSPAFTSPLVPDDVIVLVDGKEVRNVDEYNAAMKRAQPQRGALLMIDRMGSTFFVLLREE